MTKSIFYFSDAFSAIGHSVVSTNCFICEALQDFITSNVYTSFSQKKYLLMKY